MSLGYDYVVIGAGSAGPADTRPEIAVPPAWPALWGTEVDYSYNTVPQTGTGGSVHNWPRGRTLGGSSSINAMVYLRGHPADFDGWAKAGCHGWDYESVLPYFRRMETATGDPQYRGDAGPMRPARSVTPNPLSAVFLDAAAEAGHPITADFNGAVAEGAGWHELSITGGTRQSTAVAYLHPARAEHRNLTVATGARVRRLLVRDGRCTGVEYDLADELVTAYADEEVILSAGAVDSPRLLLLSGVGPAADLERAGVAVTHDLPGVGRNLHDHPLLSVVFEATRPIPPGTANHAEVSMLWRSDASRPGPDMQLMFIHLPFHQPDLQAPENSFTFGIATVPEARGSIRLAGPDPDTPPLIDPNYLGTGEDVRRLRDGIEVARQIAASGAFDGWRGREVLPGDLDPRRCTGTYYHPVGTCAMGTGPDAVVAPDLRVHGLAGLRVADASVMPTVVCVNTNAATIMIGEKAADLVRGTTEGA